MTISNSAKGHTKEVCDLITERLIAYEIKWSREGELIVMNPDGQWVFMHDNHLKCLLRNDIMAKFGKIHPTKELNKFLDIVIKNAKTIATDRDESFNWTHAEVIGNLD